jgi:hypothetical protein
VRTRLQKCRWDRFSIRPFRLANLGGISVLPIALFLPGRGLRGTAQQIGVVVTRLCKHAPGYAREFCGQGNNQYVGVQSLGRGFQPGSKAVLGPSLAPEKYGSGPLDEQCSQITIAAPRYASEDRPIARRDLFRYKAKPCCKVAALAEGITSSDRRDHCARGDRADARRAHQTATVCILIGELIDFLRE